MSSPTKSDQFANVWANKSPEHSFEASPSLVDLPVPADPSPFEDLPPSNLTEETPLLASSSRTSVHPTPKLLRRVNFGKIVQSNPWNHHSFFSKRSSGYQYDDTSEIENMENNGLRVWYDDYTTIGTSLDVEWGWDVDWIHDNVKDKLRIRYIRSLQGVRGFLYRIWNGCQAWFLVLAIGVVCGCLASMIYILQEWLINLRFGVCTESFHLHRRWCRAKFGLFCSFERASSWFR